MREAADMPAREPSNILNFFPYFVPYGLRELAVAQPKDREEIASWLLEVLPMDTTVTPESAPAFVRASGSMMEELWRAIRRLQQLEEASPEVSRQRLTILEQAMEVLESIPSRIEEQFQKVEEFLREYLGR